MSLWTGMRLNEVVQLRTDNVAILDGVDVILIREDEEGDKRLKTNASKRFVPIQRELKKMAFLTPHSPDEGTNLSALTTLLG